MILDYVQIVHPPWEVTNDLLAQYLLLWFVSFQMMMFPFEHGVFCLAWFMLFIFNCMMSKPTKGEAGIMLRLLWSQHLNANIWEFSSIETRCSFWFPKWWTRAAQNFYKACEHLLRKLEELHTAQPSSLETTHENHSTDMNIFSFNTQVSRNRPWAVKFCHSNKLFKRVTNFPSITLKIVFVTSGGSPTIRIGI
jgi:hypothetical protein